MAADTLIDKTKEEQNRKIVADSIRAKTGSSEPLAWPEGFSTAINSISGSGGKSYEVIITPNAWTIEETTGVSSQTIAVAGLKETDNILIDHKFNSAKTSQGYKEFVQQENEFLSFITNGYVETLQDSIKINIFGDKNTINIPIVLVVL